MINVKEHVTRTLDSWIHLQGRSLQWSGPFDLVTLSQSIYSYQCIFLLLRDSSFGMMFSVIMQSNYETLDWHWHTWPCLTLNSLKGLHGRLKLRKQLEAKRAKKMRQKDNCTSGYFGEIFTI